MSNLDYLKPTSFDLKETAQMIRKLLKRTFPQTKFSVRIERFSMGSAVRIAWTDGPSARQVDKLTEAFAYGGFDAMIDMQYYNSAWLLPDGRAVFGATEGTTGSGGMVEKSEAKPPVQGARLVSFGAKYVTTSRDKSANFLKGTLTAIKRKFPHVENIENLHIKETRGGHSYIDYNSAQLDRFYETKIRDYAARRSAIPLTVPA